MADTWTKLKEWPELYLERLDDAGVARITLNRPDKRNCWNRPLCNAFLESLDLIRPDKELKVVITKGAGPVYSSGLDLTFLREVSNGPLLDWDRPNLTVQIAEDIRAFPRIMIAQVHGYCLGGALGIMNCHDIVFAAEDAQLGMPEVLRGSFGQLVTVFPDFSMTRRSGWVGTVPTIGTRRSNMSTPRVCPHWTSSNCRAGTGCPAALGPARR